MANGAPEGRKRGGDGGILVSCEALWLGMGASHRLARLTRFFRLDFASCSWCIVIEWHLQYPLDERQTKNGPLLVLAENATAHALFQPQGLYVSHPSDDCRARPQRSGVELSLLRE